MELFKYVKREDWGELTERPAIDKEDLSQSVQNILNNIRDNGDKAIKTYAKQFDWVNVISDIYIPTVEKVIS